MTRDEILKMTNAELDRACAEKVMGWGSCEAGPNVWNDPKSLLFRLTGKVGMGYPNQHFSPSTDIRHAREVVERLAGLGLLNDLETTLWQFDCSKATSALLLDPADLCRAALLVVTGADT